MHDLRRTIRHILLGTIAPYSIAHGGTPAPGQLPVPCVAGQCGTNPSFVTSGTASAAFSGKSLTVNQTSNSATLNWASFNIGAGGTVTFVQPSSSAVALNRIYDSNPSQIFGNLSANGQVYLINANGFLFGSSATVNVAGLLASSLNITDSTFTNGILSPIANQAPALEPFTVSYTNFSNDLSATGSTNATKLANTGTITIAPGAQLNAADGGRLLLAGGSVDNSGTLTAPDGQVILAGGQSVYLQASQDNALRGLVVEVDAGSSSADLLSSVVNEASGSISTPRGNVTLAGLMVNQEGRISATTSVSANGSVTLTAGTTPVISGTAATLAESQGGTLSIGPTSDIEILPELSDTTTAVALQAQLPSTVTLNGQKIYIEGGNIVAPGGTLDVTASSDPAVGVKSGGDPNASLRIAAGTTIDLSGSDATLAMDANLIQVELRSNELADDPTQRGGALEGDTVTIDIRADGGAGSPIADLASAIAAVGENIAQRTESGGTAEFLSGGDLVFSPGASVNVSGGATTYMGGNVQTTKLVGANGQIYDIGSANPLLTYTGVINPTYSQAYNNFGVTQIVPTAGLSTYEPGYVQGAAAGTIQFAAPSMVLQGTLSASSVSGQYQRTASGSSMLGGTLIVGLPGNVSSTSANEFDYIAPAIDIVATPAPVAVADGTALPAAPLQLSASYITSDGFDHIQLDSNSAVQLPAGIPLTLTAGTSLQIQAPRIDIDSSITSLGGNLTFQSEPTINDGSYVTPTSAAGLPRLGIGIGNGVTLDVSGQWTNDGYSQGGVGTAPTLQNGGSIELQLNQYPAELVLGNNVTLRADGGAWEQSTAKITYGAGGAITLDASPEPGGAIQFGTNTVINAFGVGTADGGTFTLDAPAIVLEPGTGSWTEAQRVDDLTSTGDALVLFSPLLSAEGFSNISLTTTGAAASAASTDTLTVDPGSYLLQTRSLQLSASAGNHATGGPVLGFSQTLVMPTYERPIANLALNDLRFNDDAQLAAASYGSIDFQGGASITADAGATVSITGAGNITFDGSIFAPSGNVAIKLLSPFQYGVTGFEGFDPGYLPNLGITLGSQADIDVSAGAVAYTPNLQGLLLGTVGQGGTVDIDAARGSVNIEAGSQIDFAGTSQLLDVLNPVSEMYTRERVGTSGGTLTIAAADTMQILGTLRGAGGIGSTGTAAGGSLELDLAQVVGDSIANTPLPASQARVIDLVADASSLPAPTSETANIGIAQILTGTGISALMLNAGGGGGPGEIAFSTGVPLMLGRSLELEAQTLEVASGVNATVYAPTVTIGSPMDESVSGAAEVATAGTGTLAVNSDLLTLVGNVIVDGTSHLTLASTGDIQLQGTYPVAGAGQELGSLTATGQIALQAQRVYPDTYTSFSIFATGGTGPTSVSIDAAANGQASATAPLSADGAVNVNADRIEVGGSIFAPFGTINLDANQYLQLSSGSLVSVSGAGLDIPFGQTQADGAQWVYYDPLPNVSGQSGIVTTIAGTGGTSNTITGVPTKSVSLTAPGVTLQSGATVDLSGGGNVYAYEWVPGTGGSVDRLAGSGNSGNVPGLYAIIPSQPGVAAADDPEENGNLNSSQVVYLSGGAGVKAGYYALLPARDALLPGAQLIQVESSYTSASGGQIGSLANGIPVVAGYMTSYGTSQSLGSTTFEGFAIYPSGYGQKLAAYTINQGSTYFSAAATETGSTTTTPMPADAGTLDLTVVESTMAGVATALNLDGTVKTAAATGGRGALINLSAPDLEVSSNGSASTAGSLGVSATVLQSWGASQITLGGNLAANGSAATVAADHVVVDSGVNLTADQIYVLANDSIEVQGGATLASTSGKNGTALDTAPAAQTLTLSNSGAAFLGVSDLALPEVARSGSSGTATISLDSGSTLSSGGALALDAPGSILATGTLNGKGASWSLGSQSIAFVGSSGATPDTLNIDSNLQQALESAASLRLASQSSIDLIAPVTLGVSPAGSATLGSLTLVASTIDNQSGSSVILGGGNVSLGGLTTSAGTATAGSGTLTFVANNFNFAADPLAVDGFANTVLQVAGPVTSSANVASGFNVGGNLTINAPEVTPGGGGDTTITASGMMQLGAATAPAAGAAKPLVGGELALQAASIDDEGVIAAPAGVVTLTATTGDVHLGSGGVINASGTLVAAADQTAAAPGGTVALAAAGNVTLDAGSTISVAGEQAAPAGRLDIVAGGTATVVGTLAGQAGTGGTGGTGGSFSLDAQQLTAGLNPLAASLMSGGFNDAVNVHVQQGDLALSGALTANSITLTADTGAVDIGGVLSAPSAATRGLIDLSGQTVVLESGGALHADGAGSTGLGGEIDLNATCSSCSITLNPGSVITTTGSGGMGEVVLRAAAIPGTSPDDVAINQSATGITGLGADLTQAGQVIIEPVLTYATQSSTIASDLPTDVQNASDFLTSFSSAITQRLVAASGTQLGSTPARVEAGVELIDANASDSTLTLPGIDLSSYSVGMNQVINVGVRAAGSVAVGGTMSDGFISDSNTGLLALSSAPSASFNIVAGANVNSANPLAILRGSDAILTLMSSSTPADDTTDLSGPAVIRTGTGDINLAAAGDIVFAGGANTYSASVYTGGTAPANVVGPAAYDTTGGNSILMNFAAGGGTVRLAAGGNVVGVAVGVNDPALDGGDYGVNGWLLHQGSASQPAQYGVDYGAFDWNVGSLGGGDILVSAGGSVSNLSAAVSDSYVSADNTQNNTATQYGAGGGLVIHAGGDIGSPQIYVADGTGVLTADGALSATRTYTSGSTQVPVGAAIALGNSDISIWVRNGLTVDAIYNPTLVPQLVNDSSLIGGGYSTYGTDSSVSLSTTSGDANFNVSSTPIRTALGALVGQYEGASTYSYIAPTLNMRALQGDINLTGGAAAFMMPSATGQLTLFAGADITNATNTSIVMADTLLSTIPTIANPGLAYPSPGSPFSGAIHVGDSSPALVTAGEDIDNLALEVPKATQVVAGRDIVNLSFQGQNVSSNDVTLIAAGRDFTDTSQNGSGVVVGGPGSVDLLAGRNVDFGFSPGIVTTGSLVNSNLASTTGASISLMVGYGSQDEDITGFLTKIIAPSSGYQSQLIAYVEALNGESGLTFAQASADFTGLTTTQQTALVDSVFFSELLLSGRSANSGTGQGFAEGYAAIDALFPESRSTTAGASPYSGSLTLSSSQIYTDDGGNISILVPGGGIDVGLANAPPGVAAKPASQLGIVAEGAGNVDIYALNDVNVNTSRIFTLGGGSILIWSTLGSIDAGNGSKSSLSVPPPTISINKTGQVTLNFGSSLAAGSGIRTIQTNADVSPGNVDLDAPVGTVNAGDAGIGASGNINIAAAHVIGVDNINFGGTATGVPSDVSSLGASLSGATAAAAGTSSSSTNSAESANEAAKEVAPIAQAALSWLDVFVTGLGDENCKQDDIDCLKRQKSAAP